MYKLKKSSMIVAYAIILIVLPIVSCVEIDSTTKVSYIPNVEDIPLPDGFSVNDDEVFIYDTLDGRIVYARASGSRASGYGSKDKIIKFYNETLPQLGWKASVNTTDSASLFERDNEELKLNIELDEDLLTIIFSLSPIDE